VGHHPVHFAPHPDQVCRLLARQAQLLEIAE